MPGNDGFREIPDITLFVTFPLQDISPGGVLCIGLSFLSDVTTAAGRLQKFLLIVKSQVAEQGDI